MSAIIIGIILLAGSIGYQIGKAAGMNQIERILSKQKQPRRIRPDQTETEQE